MRLTIDTIAADFDRFFADLTTGSHSSTKPRRVDEDRVARGTNRKISAEEIYERALALLDEEGVAALTVRRLAEELRISTRTLYKRVGSRQNVIRNAVRLHFERLDIGCRQGAPWESTASQWCFAVHGALSEHPHVTELLAEDDANVIEQLGGNLVKAALDAGFSPHVSDACCRALLTVTINDAIRQVRTIGHVSAARLASPVVAPTKSFSDTIGWILAGVRAGDVSAGDAM